MSGLLTETHLARAVGLRQWRSGVRDVLPRVCCRCSLPIWPWQRHHKVAVDRPKKAWRRIHYRRCPGDTADSLPRYSPADQTVTVAERLLIAAGWTFAAIVFAALFMALGYQW